MLGALVGLAVALAVPMWLVVEEFVQRFTPAERSGLKADVPAPAPGLRAPAHLSRKAA